MNSRQNRPLVSIITLNYNGRRFLKTLFDSLQACSYPNLEIIMVDNDSGDDSVAFVSENYPGVKILQNDRNYLYAGGNNRGLAVASGEYICVINNDVEVHPGFIEPVIEAFETHPRVMAIQPKIRSLQQRDCFEYAGSCGGFIDRLGYPFVRGRILFTIEKDAGQYDAPAALFWASGACFFLRKSVLSEVGYFDEDFGLHMEEIDLCWRIRLAGGEILSLPQSQIWHHVGGTLDQENPRKVFWNFRNNLFLLLKNLSLPRLFPRLLLRFPLDFLALLVEILKGHYRSALAIIKAYAWAGSHIPLMLRKRREVQQKRRVSDGQIFKYVYPGSIVFEYFLLGRRTFSNLLFVDKILHPAGKPGESPERLANKKIDPARAG